MSGVIQLEYGHCSFSTNGEKRLIDADDNFLKIIGYSRDELLGGKVSFDILVPPEELEDIQRQIELCKTSGDAFCLRHTIIRKKGGLIIVHSTGILHIIDNIEKFDVYITDFTEQSELLSKYNTSQLELEILTSNVPGGVVIYSVGDYAVYRCNDELKRIMGFSEETEITKLINYSNNPDAQRFMQASVNAVEYDTSMNVELKAEVNGSEKWLRVIGKFYRFYKGKPLMYALVFDITKDKKMTAELEMQAARYRLLSESTYEIFFEYDVKTDTITFANQINRYGDSTVRNYLYGDRAKANVHEEDYGRYVDFFKRSLLTPHSGSMEIRTKAFDDDYTWYKIPFTSVVDESGRVAKVYGLLSNIQHLKNLSQRVQRDSEYINHLITTDSVTGLLNFKTFKSQAGELLRFRDMDYVYGVVYSDINGFSYINDNFGFELGDKMLRQFGKIVSKVETNLLACRIYSDFFIGLYRAKTREELIKSIERRNMLFMSQQKMLFPDSNLNISCGMYIYDEKDTDISQAIDNANLARKSVKGLSASICGIYASRMRIQRAKEQQIANELFSAIENKYLEMFLQPKFSMDTMEIIGAEALARWRKVDGGYKMPCEFIDVLEKVGYIDELDFYIYEEVLKTLVDWERNGKKCVPISVNFSRHHVKKSDFAENIIRLADKYGINKKLVEIEITESCFADDSARLFNDMKKLQDSGFLIDIDDFGVGYSTLGVLLKAPVDIVKIDKSFIDELTINNREQAYVKGICQLVTTANKDIIFEGVETKEQASILCSIGYTKAQGWLFDKALPLEEFNRKYM